MRPSIVIFALTAVGSSTAAMAAVPTSKLQALSACRAETDEHTRLACYDDEVGKLIKAVGAHDVVLMGRADMQETRRGLFGFNLPKMSLFGSNGDDGSHTDVSEIDAVVQSTASLGNGNWRMRLENGAIWDTTDAVAWDPPHAGSKVHIKRGAFGSYSMRIDGSIPIHALRSS